MNTMSTMKKMLGTTTLALAALLLLANPATAGDPADDGSLTIQLTATKYGAQVNAAGMARINEPEKGVETFGVVVFADVKDGKNYVVEVTTANKGIYKVADLDMNMGVGGVKQSNVTHKTKAFPIAELISVTVRDRGGVVLSGSFWY